MSWTIFVRPSLFAKEQFERNVGQLFPCCVDGHAFNLLLFPLFKKKAIGPETLVEKLKFNAKTIRDSKISDTIANKIIAAIANTFQLNLLEEGRGLEALKINHSDSVILKDLINRLSEWLKEYLGTSSGCDKHRNTLDNIIFSILQESHLLGPRRYCMFRFKLWLYSSQ